MGLLALQGCSSFVPVRSAEVAPGTRVDVSATLTTPPGDAAAWFWTYDCESECNGSIPSLDIGVTKAVVPRDGGRPFEVGAGVAGFYPYFQAYVQLGRGPRPFGIGTRASLSLVGWYEVSIFGRYDVPLGRATRLMLVPGVFLHGGNSPNGANPGRFIALAQGVGLEQRVGRTSISPSLLFVLGRVDRYSYRQGIHDVTGLLVVGVSVRP